MKELNLIQTALKAPKTHQAKGQTGKVIYNYRSCEDILEAVKPLLKEHKCTLTLTDEVVMIGNRFYVRANALIVNDLGEKMLSTAYAREPENLATMNPSQVTGAASSYARKYALNGLLAIDDNRDLDDIQDTPQQQPEQKPAQPAASSLAAKKEDELIAQLRGFNTIEELQKFYGAAPVALQKKETRFYQAVTARAMEIQNA